MMKLSHIDQEVMERAFGSELPEEMLGALEAIRGVDSKAFDGRVMVDMLLANAVNNGLDGRIPLGWRLSRDGDWWRLQVFAMKAEEREAA